MRVTMSGTFSDLKILNSPKHVYSIGNNKGPLVSGARCVEWHDNSPLMIFLPRCSSLRSSSSTIPVNCAVTSPRAVQGAS